MSEGSCMRRRCTCCSSAHTPRAQPPAGAAPLSPIPTLCCSHGPAPCAGAAPPSPSVESTLCYQLGLLREAVGALAAPTLLPHARALLGAADAALLVRAQLLWLHACAFVHLCSAFAHCLAQRTPRSWCVRSCCGCTRVCVLRRAFARGACVCPAEEQRGRPSGLRFKPGPPNFRQKHWSSTSTFAQLHPHPARPQAPSRPAQNAGAAQA